MNETQRQREPLGRLDERRHLRLPLVQRLDFQHLVGLNLSQVRFGYDPIGLFMLEKASVLQPCRHFLLRQGSPFIAREFAISTGMFNLTRRRRCTGGSSVYPARTGRTAHSSYKTHNETERVQVGR